MSRLRRSVPSVGALVAFEAAARRGGFTAAARELGVTQAAISRHVRGLEADLRAPLFLREGRGVTLTAAGRVLAATLSDSFERIADALEVIRQPGGPRTLAIGATLAVSSFWLLPRLPAFRAAHPDAALRVMSQDEPFDLREGGCEVCLRYGTGPWPDGESVASAAAEIFPVCSPAFLAGLGGPVEPARLAALPLIANEARDPSWTGWEGWLAAAGVTARPPRPALRFSHYSDCVYAAIAGEGVALGWRLLLDRPLADGRLTRLCAFSVTPEARFHLVAAPGAARDPLLGRLVDWLAAEIAGAPAPLPPQERGPSSGREG